MESEGGAKKRSRFSLKEPLKVGGTAEVPGSVVEVLACHQLEGIRFIHRGLKQNKGVILNDESGLGKTHQVVGYLSATVGPADKSAIVCSSLQRVHHWMYHLGLLTELTTVVLGDGDSVHLSGNKQIILATFDSFERQSDLFLSKEKEIKLLVVDETKNEQCEIPLLTLISKFTTAAKLFLTTRNILDDLVRLSLRLKLCQLQFHGETLKELLQGVNPHQPLSKSRKLKLFFLTRSVLLRRYRSHHKGILPLIEESEFRSCFTAWKIANGMEGCQSQVLLEDSQILVEQSIESETIESTSGLMFNQDLGENDTVCDTSLNRAIVGDAESSGIGRDLSHEIDDDGNDRSAETVAYKVSEPLFDCEQSTEEMPKLVLESSDSESKSPVDTVKKSTLAKASESEMTRCKTPNIEVPETERSSQATDHQTDSEGYLEFGQALVQPNSQSESSSETLVRKSATVLADDKYNFPIDRLLRRKSPSSSSTDLEVLSKESARPNQPILVSSSSSNGREKSPDLFSDTDDEEADETVKFGTQDDSLMNLLLKSPVNLEKTSKPNAPKPLPKLLRANVSTPISKLLHGSLHKEPDLSLERSSSNDIFADLSVKNPDRNRTDVFEITDNNAFGNRIQVHAENDSMSPLRDSDDVQFVSVLRGPDNPIEIVDLDTEVCTPKSQNGPPPNRARRTPSSKGSLPSTPRGWLTKGNRSSDGDSSSPRTPTTGRKSASTERARRSTGSSNVKRRKLENWFRDDDDDDDFEDCRRVSTSVNRRKSAPSSSAGCVKRISPRKKCFQDRIYQRYNQILVSPSGVDSDFE